LLLFSRFFGFFFFLISTQVPFFCEDFSPRPVFPPKTLAVGVTSPGFLTPFFSPGTVPRFSHLRFIFFFPRFLYLGVLRWRFWGSVLRSLLPTFLFLTCSGNQSPVFFFRNSPISPLCSFLTLLDLSVDYTFLILTPPVSLAFWPGRAFTIFSEDVFFLEDFFAAFLLICGDYSEVGKLPRHSFLYKFFFPQPHPVPKTRFFRKHSLPDDGFF